MARFIKWSFIIPFDQRSLTHFLLHLFKTFGFCCGLFMITVAHYPIYLIIRTFFLSTAMRVSRGIHTTSR